MDDREKQIPPPKSWEKFEDLCHELFKAVWGDSFAQKNGRRGQPQHGVDIFGSPNGNYETCQGVQCKGKDGLYGRKTSVPELEREIAKAEGFEPLLQHWIFATTAPVDAKLQKTAREISASRTKKGRFTVSVLGWEEIVTLLCRQKQVLSEFYPEHTFDIPKLLDSVQQMPQGSEVRELLSVVRRMGTRDADDTDVHPIWRPVVFREGRDLGPAFMGRSLGPGDASACPRLLEADIAVNELKQAYSTRIAGVPGAGKSVCAYQTALHFANSGWSVFRLSDPRVETVDPKASGFPQRTLFIIDDAHLMTKAALREAEDAAGPNCLILSVHNSLEHDTSSRGAIVIDAKRAVRTIASALRNDPESTLEVVRRIDRYVGSLSSDVSLEDRIAEAEQRAEYPWQFCFIVGGGWRRAARVAAAARSAHADITLAGIAIRQIASRDARPSGDEISALLSVGGLNATEVRDSVQWLVDNRWVIGLHDLRCPHQRFALAALVRILAGQDGAGHGRIGRLLQHVVADAQYTLAGLWSLLYGFRLEGSVQRWGYLFTEPALQPLIRRCWGASDPVERTYASLLFSELGTYVRGWPRRQLEGRQVVLGRWISNPQEPSGYGLARLLHAVWNKDRVFAKALVETSQPSEVAAAVSAATPKTAYNLGELVSGLKPDSRTAWGGAFVQGLDRPKLAAVAAAWPEAEPAWAFANLCRGLVYTDESLALDMLSHFIPTARKLLSRDTVSAFRDLFHLATDVLRMLDVLGLYVGRMAPTARHRALARQMLQDVVPLRLAEELSGGGLRQFQNTGFLLAFMQRAAPAKFRATVAAMDWTRIADAIGDYWRNLPHEAEVLFGVAYRAEDSRKKLAQVIYDNLHRIEAFPARLVFFARSAAYKHAEGGGVIRLAQHDHVDWWFGVAAIACFAEERPALVEVILRPSETTTGRVLSQAHSSWYAEAADYVDLLKTIVPESLQRILDAVDVRGAEVGWTAALRSGKGARRTVALLVEASIERRDGLGVLGRRLRSRFPAASVPGRSRLNLRRISV